MNTKILLHEALNQQINPLLVKALFARVKGYVLRGKLNLTIGRNCALMSFS
jgi:hypothetical protein